MHSAPFVIHNGRFYCASNYSTGCHDVTSFCGCTRAIRAEAFRFSAILFARSMRRVYFTPTKSYALNNWCFYSVIPCPYSQGRIYVGAGARFTCCSQIQKLADHSDVISGVRKCSKIQIFRDPYLMGRELAGPCQEPHTRCRPLEPCVYGSQGTTLVGNPTNDRFQ